MDADPPHQGVKIARRNTTARLRGRIEAVLDAYNAAHERAVLNPARWKGDLEHVLAARKTIAAVKRHPAVPWPKLPAFMAKLAGQSGTGALALRFAIGARTNEVLGRARPVAAAQGDDRPGRERRSDHGCSGCALDRAWQQDEGKAGPPSAVVRAALDLLREALVLRVSQDPAAPIFLGQDWTGPMSYMTMTARLRRMGFGFNRVPGAKA